MLSQLAYDCAYKSLYVQEPVISKHAVNYKV